MILITQIVSFTRYAIPYITLYCALNKSTKKSKFFIKKQWFLWNLLLVRILGHLLYEKWTNIPNLTLQLSLYGYVSFNNQFMQNSHFRLPLYRVCLFPAWDFVLPKLNNSILSEGWYITAGRVTSTPITTHPRSVFLLSRTRLTDRVHKGVMYVWYVRIWKNIQYAPKQTSASYFFGFFDVGDVLFTGRTCFVSDTLIALTRATREGEQKINIY
jgi:hypothetical protein